MTSLSLQKSRERKSEGSAETGSDSQNRPTRFKNDMWQQQQQQHCLRPLRDSRPSKEPALPSNRNQSQPSVILKGGAGGGASRQGGCPGRGVKPAPLS